MERFACRGRGLKLFNARLADCDHVDDEQYKSSLAAGATVSAVRRQPGAKAIFAQT